MSADRWRSRWAAHQWLFALGGPQGLAEVLAAANRAKSAAGPGLDAVRVQARSRRNEQVVDLVSQIQVALKGLRKLEREELGERSRSLQEAIAGPAPHWHLLDAVEESVRHLARGLPPSARARGQGEKSTAEEAVATGRYLSELFQGLIGRGGTPRELALLEIAVGFAPPCRDEGEFTARRKRWSKRRPK